MPLPSPATIRQWCKLTSWTPHAGQQAAIDALRRYTVLVCGRRWGKTTLAARIAGAGALEAPAGAPVWIVGESYEITDIALDECHASLRAAEQTIGGIRLVARYSRGDHRIELRGGQRIEGKSAEHPEGMLGRGVWGVIFEEAAATPQRIFEQYIRPALTDHRGWCMFPTTPRGRANWIYELSGEHERDVDFALVHSPSWQNSHLFPGGNRDPEILVWRGHYERLGLLALWEQECCGSFAQLQGRVYQAWDPARHLAPLSQVGAGVHEWRLAIDWGFRNPCCILVIGRTGDGGYRVAAEWYERGRTLDEVAVAARALAQRWNAWAGWADPSEPGNIEALNRAGLRIRPAANDVTSGILAVARALGRDGGMLIAERECPHLAREAENYCWREGTSRGDREEPVKIADHAVDAWRYGVASWDRMLGDQPVLSARLMYGARSGGLRGGLGPR